MHAALGNARADQLGAVPLLNSWGAHYPHRVYMPDDVLKKLAAKGGVIGFQIGNEFHNRKMFDGG